jgi:hypothetical protein
MPNAPGLTIAGFQSQVSLEGRIHKWEANVVSDLNAIVTALGSDATRRDNSFQTAPIAVRPGVAPPTHSKLTNDICALINMGKASGLLPSAMATAITTALTNILPPTISVAPVVSGLAAIGSTLTTTNGTWNFTPVSFRYQWLRAGAFIPGQINSTYVSTQADHLLAVSCRVMAANQAGQGSADSNTISVA